jgi:translocator protein
LATRLGLAFGGFATYIDVMLDVAFPFSDLPSLGKLAIVLVTCFAIAALGSVGTTPNLPWHAALTKPPLNPPNWLFGPAWTVLFTLMAFAAWRIWTLDLTPAQSAALWLFTAQLIVNAAWSWAFFGMRSPLGGIIVIIPFLLLVLSTVVAFWRLDAVSGWMMLPYPIWVSFATYLNVGIWWLNRSPAAA